MFKTRRRGLAVLRKYSVRLTRQKKLPGVTLKKRRFVSRRSFTFYSLFFNYFFQHWFKVSSIVLYKPLLSYLFVLPGFKTDLTDAVFKTEYLHKEA